MTAVRCATAVLCMVIARPVLAQTEAASNVPDVLTRQSGLRLTPMSHTARVYAENCQGCHGPQGVSVTEIPTLVGRVGYFARSPEGRSYLIQVPNVALNPGSDEEIAGLMNWLLNTYSRRQMPDDFKPYSAAEVGLLRKQRVDIAAQRRRIVDQLWAAGQIPSREALAIPRSVLY
ncbi:MAG: c-type cytochrome [Steroidobacterales bacterium]